MTIPSANVGSAGISRIYVGGTLVEDFAPGTVTFARQIATDSDDAEERTDTGAVNLTSTDLELLFDVAGQVVGLRFPNVTVPRGSTIGGAHIQFSTEAPSESAGSPTFTIQGHLSVDAPTFGTATNGISGRTRTAASVSWSPPAWTVADERGPAQRTEDLGPIVQELVNQAGWQSGGALAFIVTGTQSATARRTAHAFNAALAAHAPELVVEYIAPPPTPLLQTGLLAEHRFNDGSGQQITDHSGNNYYAQLGSTSGADANDPAWNASGWLTGDGVDDFAAIDPGVAVTTGSFSILVRPEFVIDGSVLRRAMVLGGQQMKVNLDHPNSAFAQVIEVRRASDSAFLAASFGTITQNTWVVISGVFDGANLRAYRNGVLQTTTPVNGQLSTSQSIINYFSAVDATDQDVKNFFGASSIAYGIVRTHPMTAEEVAAEYDYIRTQVAARGISLPAIGEEPPPPPPPPDEPVHFIRQITAASDDAEERTDTGAVDLISSDLELLFDDAAGAQIVGVRFPSVMVPAGATIVSAYIQFSTESPAESAGSPTFTIQGHLAADAPTFGTATNSISGRTRTAASVSWSPPAWTVADEREPAQRTADLTTIVQELVNQSAPWVPGGGMAFIITGTQSATARRTAHSSASANHAPSLVIEYIGEDLGGGWTGTAVNDSYDVVAGSGVNVLNVQENDTGLDGTETTQLLSGSATVNANGKSLNYTAPSTAGSTNLTYRLSHPGSGQVSNTATVAVATVAAGGGGGGVGFPANHNMGTIVNWAGITLMPGSSFPSNRTWPTTFRTPEQHGAVGNGTTNDAPAINACIAFAKSNGMGVRFGANKIYRMDAKFNSSTLNGWNSLLWEGNNATIRMGPDVTALSGPGECQFFGCRGVRIYDLTFDGRRQTRHAVTNDYFSGHNFSMLACHDVAFIRVKSHRAMTDGWRISASGTVALSNIPTWNVLIDCEGFDNARLGVGLIHGIDIYVKRGRFNEHKVRAPTAGMDIEPTKHFDPVGVSVRRCQVDSVEFSDNYKFGFVLANLGVTPLRDVWLQNCIIQRNGGRHPLHGAQGSHSPFYASHEMDNINILNNTIRNNTLYDEFTMNCGAYLAIGAGRDKATAGPGVGNIKIIGNKFSGNKAKFVVASTGAVQPANTISAHNDHRMSTIQVTNNLLDIRNTGNHGVNMPSGVKPANVTVTGNTVWRKSSDGTAFFQNAGGNTTHTVTHDNPVF